MSKWIRALLLWRSDRQVCCTTGKPENGVVEIIVFTELDSKLKVAKVLLEWWAGELLRRNLWSGSAEWNALRDSGWRSWSLITELETDLMMFASCIVCKIKFMFY